MEAYESLRRQLHIYLQDKLSFRFVEVKDIHRFGNIFTVHLILSNRRSLSRLIKAPRQVRFTVHPSDIQKHAKLDLDWDTNFCRTVYHLLINPLR